jgi:hypothetical protein
MSCMAALIRAQLLARWLLAASVGTSACVESTVSPALPPPNLPHARDVCHYTDDTQEGECVIGARVWIQTLGSNA